MDPLLIVFGLGVGMLVGLTGMGGGSLMTPLLILVFGVKPVTAIGTDLAYAAVTKTVGGLKHFRQRTVELGLSTWMALGSVPAAIGGVYVLAALERAHGDDFDELLLTLLAAALLFTGSRSSRGRCSCRSSCSGNASTWSSMRATSSPPSRSACSSASCSGSPRQGAAR